MLELFRRAVAYVRCLLMRRRYGQQWDCLLSWSPDYDIPNHTHKRMNNNQKHRFHISLPLGYRRHDLFTLYRCVLMPPISAAIATIQLSTLSVLVSRYSLCVRRCVTCVSIAPQFDITLSSHSIFVSFSFFLLLCLCVGFEEDSNCGMCFSAFVNKIHMNNLCFNCFIHNQMMLNASIIHIGTKNCTRCGWR